MTRKGSRRSVLPLPDYTRRKPLAGGRWGYYFTPPSWALNPREGEDRGPCPVGCEALGTDYDAAVKRVERVLLPVFDSWRTRGLAELAPQGPRKGTLDWLFTEYRGTLAYQKLSRKVARCMRRASRSSAGISSRMAAGSARSRLPQSTRLWSIRSTASCCRCSTRTARLCSGRMAPRVNGAPRSITR
jgi:hypothetical protein